MGLHNMIRGIIAGIVLAFGVGLIFTKDYLLSFLDHRLSRSKNGRSNKEDLN